ncbi:MAG: hypothetical protein EZS28_007917 [Streblomastix strix]|uniref:Uncharacterized protein n=1 Tax=Streblomastix strix TaxID=222440 RepID=A0A5J4WQ84_9EUKA|nr:MAG: hypothetical protein EZS28_007917 [Streblomastix strix]
MTEHTTEAVVTDQQNEKEAFNEDPAEKESLTGDEKESITGDEKESIKLDEIEVESKQNIEPANINEEQVVEQVDNNKEIQHSDVQQQDPSIQNKDEPTEQIKLQSEQSQNFNSQLIEQTSSPNKKVRFVLSITVRGQHSQLSVLEGQTVEKAAYKFCAQNNLSDSICQALIRSLKVAEHQIEKKNSDETDKQLNVTTNTSKENETKKKLKLFGIKRHNQRILEKNEQQEQERRIREEQRLQREKEQVFKRLYQDNYRKKEKINQEQELIIQDFLQQSVNKGTISKQEEEQLIQRMVQNQKQWKDQLLQRELEIEKKRQSEFIESEQFREEQKKNQNKLKKIFKEEIEKQKKDQIDEELKKGIEKKKTNSKKDVSMSSSMDQSKQEYYIRLSKPIEREKIPVSAGPPQDANCTFKPQITRLKSPSLQQTDSFDDQKDKQKGSNVVKDFIERQKANEELKRTRLDESRKQAQNDTTFQPDLSKTQFKTDQIIDKLIDRAKDVGKIARVKELKLIDADYDEDDENDDDFNNPDDIDDDSSKRNKDIVLTIQNPTSQRSKKNDKNTDHGMKREQSWYQFGGIYKPPSIPPLDVSTRLYSDFVRREKKWTSLEMEKYRISEEENQRKETIKSVFDQQSKIDKGEGNNGPMKLDGNQITQLQNLADSAEQLQSLHQTKTDLVKLNTSLIKKPPQQKESFRGTLPKRLYPTRSYIAEYLSSAMFYPASQTCLGKIPQSEEEAQKMIQDQIQQQEQDEQENKPPLSDAEIELQKMMASTLSARDIGIGQFVGENELKPTLIMTDDQIKQITNRLMDDAKRRQDGKKQMVVDLRRQSVIESRVKVKGKSKQIANEKRRKRIKKLFAILYDTLDNKNHQSEQASERSEKSPPPVSTSVFMNQSVLNQQQQQQQQQFNDKQQEQGEDASLEEKEKKDDREDNKQQIKHHPIVQLVQGSEYNTIRTRDSAKNSQKGIIDGVSIKGQANVQMSIDNSGGYYAISNSGSISSLSPRGSDTFITPMQMDSSLLIEQFSYVDRINTLIMDIEKLKEALQNDTSEQYGLVYPVWKALQEIFLQKPKLNQTIKASQTKRSKSPIKAQQQKGQKTKEKSDNQQAVFEEEKSEQIISEEEKQLNNLFDMGNQQQPQLKGGNSDKQQKQQNQLLQDSIRFDIMSNPALTTVTFASYSHLQPYMGVDQFTNYIEQNVMRPSISKIEKEQSNTNQQISNINTISQEHYIIPSLLPLIDVFSPLTINDTKRHIRRKRRISTDSHSNRSDNSLDVIDEDQKEKEDEEDLDITNIGETDTMAHIDHDKFISKQKKKEQLRQSKSPFNQHTPIKQTEKKRSQSVQPSQNIKRQYSISPNRSDKQKDNMDNKQRDLNQRKEFHVDRKADILNISPYQSKYAGLSYQEAKDIEYEEECTFKPILCPMSELLADKKRIEEFKELDYIQQLTGMKPQVPSSKGDDKSNQQEQDDYPSQSISAYGNRSILSPYNRSSLVQNSEIAEQGFDSPNINKIDEDYEKEQRNGEENGSYKSNHTQNKSKYDQVTVKHVHIDGVGHSKEERELNNINNASFNEQQEQGRSASPYKRMTLTDRLMIDAFKRQKRKMDLEQQHIEEITKECTHSPVLNRRTIDLAKERQIRSASGSAGLNLYLKKTQITQNNQNESKNQKQIVSLSTSPNKNKNPQQKSPHQQKSISPSQSKNKSRANSTNQQPVKSADKPLSIQTPYTQTIQRIFKQNVSSQSQGKHQGRSLSNNKTQNQKEINVNSPQQQDNSPLILKQIRDNETNKDSQWYGNNKQGNEFEAYSPTQFFYTSERALIQQIEKTGSTTSSQQQQTPTKQLPYSDSEYDQFQERQKADNIRQRVDMQRAIEQMGLNQTLNDLEVQEESLKIVVKEQIVQKNDKSKKIVETVKPGLNLNIKSKQIQRQPIQKNIPTNTQNSNQNIPKGSNGQNNPS